LAGHRTDVTGFGKPAAAWAFSSIKAFVIVTIFIAVPETDGHQSHRLRDFASLLADASYLAYIK